MLFRSRENRVSYAGQQHPGEPAICVGRIEPVSILSSNGTMIMPATLSKTDVLKAVEALPDEPLTLGDIIEHLMVLQKVQTALTEEGIPHEQVVAAFQKPPAERQWGS